MSEEKSKPPNKLEQETMKKENASRYMYIYD